MPLNDISVPGGNTYQVTVDENGSSLTNWTQESGSWTTDGTNFSVATAGTVRMYVTAPIKHAGLIYKADVQMKSTGSHAGVNRIGINFGWDASGGGGTQQALDCSGLTPASNGRNYTEAPHGTTVTAVDVVRFNVDQWYRLTAVMVGHSADYYRDGVYIFSSLTAMDTAINHVGLSVVNCDAMFRNVKAYTIDIPASLL